MRMRKQSVQQGPAIERRGDASVREPLTMRERAGGLFRILLC